MKCRNSHVQTVTAYLSEIKTKLKQMSQRLQSPEYSRTSQNLGCESPKYSPTSPVGNSSRVEAAQYSPTSPVGNWSQEAAQSPEYSPPMGDWSQEAAQSPEYSPTSPWGSYPHANSELYYDTLQLKQSQMTQYKALLARLQRQKAMLQHALQETYSQLERVNMSPSNPAYHDIHS